MIAADEASRLQAAAAVLCLVNGVRERQGIAPLRESSLLDGAATEHSADMVSRKFFSHFGSNGSSFRSRVARTGYTRGSAGALIGETLAWGCGPFATPTEIVGSFQESAEHRRTILDRRFREVGVGLALGAPERGVLGGTTATLDFGRRR